MWYVFALEFVLLGVVMAVTLRHFASKRTAWHVYFTVWFSWTVAVAIVWILPLDLFYVLKQRCEDAANETCPKIVLNDLEGDDVLIDYMWKTVYWACQLFGWVILTMQQSFIDAGQFTILGKLYQALKENLIIILVGGILVASFVTYLAFVHHMTLDSVIPVLMAVTNCFGLLIVILLLSYGLVELPRTIWQKAFLNKCLMRAEFDAVAVVNNLDDAKAELATCLAEVKSASSSIVASMPTHRYIEQIVAECPPDVIAVRSDNPDAVRDDVDPQIHTMSRIISLRRRLNRAIVRYRKAKTRWISTIERGLFLQDVIRSVDEETFRITSDLRPPRSGKYAKQKDHIEYIWTIYIKPVLLGMLAFVCGVLSLALLISEVVIMPAISSQTDTIWGRSPISYIIRRFGSDDVIVLILVFLPLSYACVAVYFSLFRLKIFNIYEVVANETDDVSLLFTGYFITRLVPAICYNFLNMLGETHETLDTDTYKEGSLTVFERNFKAMGTVPLLGDNYNNWLPPIIIVFCIGTLANVGSRCLRLCNVNRFQFADSLTDDQVCDGRIILQDERRQRLRPENSVRPPPTPPHMRGIRGVIYKFKRVFRRGQGEEGPDGTRPSVKWDNQWQRLQDEINQL